MGICLVFLNHKRGRDAYEIHKNIFSIKKSPNNEFLTKFMNKENFKQYIDLGVENGTLTLSNDT